MADHYDLDLLVEQYGLVVGKKNAKRVYVLCVFHHERTPSLIMWRFSQTYHCHGCQKKGSIEELRAYLDTDPPRPKEFQSDDWRQLWFDFCDWPF